MGSSSVSPEGCPVSGRWAEGGVPRADAADNAEIEVPEAGLKAPESGAEITEVEWELISRPPLWLIPDEGSDSQLDWVADEQADAQARLSYLEDGKRIEEIVTFPVHVDVTSDGRDAQTEMALRCGFPRRGWALRARRMPHRPWTPGRRWCTVDQSVRTGPRRGCLPQTRIEPPAAERPQPFQPEGGGFFPCANTS